MVQRRDVVLDGYRDAEQRRRLGVREQPVAGIGVLADVLLVERDEDIEPIAPRLHLLHAVQCAGNGVVNADGAAVRACSQVGDGWRRTHASSAVSWVESRGTRRKPSRTSGANAS